MTLDILRLFVIYFTSFILLTIVGYQSLLPVLHNGNIFAYLCASEETVPCNSQDLRLDMMFNLSITTLNAVCLLWGLLCLKYGPKIGVIIGGPIITISPLIFSFGYDWPCFISYIAMGIGTGGVLFGVIGIPAEYPQIQGFLFSLLIGCFDASSGIFYIFLLLYQHIHISMQILFVILSIISCICCLLVYFFVFSSRFEQKPEKKNTDEIQTTNIQDSNSANMRRNVHDDEPLIIKNELELSEQSIFQILKSKELIHLVIWSMFYMLTKYFYITTMDKQISWITNDDGDKVYIAQQIFSVMLLLSGLYSFITGPLIDKCGMKFALILMSFVSLIGCICSVIKVYYLQLFTMVCFVFNRFFYFAMAPLLIVVIFGMEKQQMIYGLVLCVSAMFNLLGYVLDDWVTYHLNGNYTIVNLITGAMCFVVALKLCYALRNQKNVT